MFGNFKRDHAMRALTAMAQEIHPALQVISKAQLHHDHSPHVLNHFKKAKVRQDTEMILCLNGIKDHQDMLPLYFYEVNPLNSDWLGPTRQLIYDDKGNLRAKDFLDTVHNITNLWKRREQNSPFKMKCRVNFSYFSRRTSIVQTSYPIHLPPFEMCVAHEFLDFSHNPVRYTGYQQNRPLPIPLAEAQTMSGMIDNGWSTLLDRSRHIVPFGAETVTLLDIFWTMAEDMIDKNSKMLRETIDKIKTYDTTDLVKELLGDRYVPKRLMNAIKRLTKSPSDGPGH
jgi:hypothetical protein